MSPKILSMTPLLKVEGLTMRFGGIVALNNVNFQVQPGSITALIGPNGAGKTTVFNCVTGFYRATEGRLTFSPEGHTYNIGKLLGEPFQAADFVKPVAFAERLYYKMFGGSHRVASAGIARTFQNIRLFREMTAFENLLVAQHHRLVRNPILGLIRSASYRRSEAEAVERAYFWLKALNLADAGNRLAGELPYGHQRRLEIARAMCINPKMICLDEPAAGLNPAETAELSEMIQMLRREHGVTVLLIEHDMSLVMRISEHIVVLDHGEVICAGDPHTVANDPKVIAAYLGTESTEEAARA
ncbi:MAG TPA: ATP-binding cassette domain-containing protein [Candidatus Competibacteraceae bacterium]|nr:ATP-binding cassette domain-containing protein [Candidatus Competibacteraceae bacterium]